MMKKLFSFAAGLVALLSLSACQGLIDSWNEIPGFTVMPELYDGQNVRIIRLTKCHYAWKISDPSILKLTVTDEEEAWLEVAYPAGETDPIKVTITATNADKPDQEPFKTDVYVCPWRLTVLKEQNDGTWERDNDCKGVGGHNFSVVMEGLKPVDQQKKVYEWKSISELLMAQNGLKPEYDKLTWKVDDADKTYLKDWTEHETYATFSVPGLIDEIPISATLGKVTHKTKVIDSTF